MLEWQQSLPISYKIPRSSADSQRNAKSLRSGKLMKWRAPRDRQFLSLSLTLDLRRARVSPARSPALSWPASRARRDRPSPPSPPRRRTSRRGPWPAPSICPSAPPPTLRSSSWISNPTLTSSPSSARAPAPSASTASPGDGRDRPLRTTRWASSPVASGMAASAFGIPWSWWGISDENSLVQFAAFCI